MPDRKIHIRAGAVAGAVTAIATASNQDLYGMGLEGLGGLLGGMLGGRLPDLIDPPVNPRHRGIGHAVLPAGTVELYGVAHIKSLQEACRSFAEQSREAAGKARNANDYIKYGMLYILSHMAAGFLPGLLAGYGSHLVLDLRTHARLPILLKGY